MSLYEVTREDHDYDEDAWFIVRAVDAPAAKRAVRDRWKRSAVGTLTARKLPERNGVLTTFVHHG